MKRFSTLLLAVVLLAWSAVAQTGTQAQSQTTVGASSNTNVSADKGGVKAQNDTSATASQNATVDRKGKGKTKGESSGNANTSSSQSASLGPNDASAAAGTTLNAVLTKSVDSRKAKEGDEVTAKTTGDMKAEGQRTIPKGAKLIGHVTKANARAKGDSESALGIVFDRAEVAKGREVPIHAVVQALAAVRTSSSMAMNEEPVGPSDRPTPSSGSATGGGGVLGGTVAGVGKTVDNTAGTVGGVTQQAGSGVGSAVGSTTGTVNSTTNAAATLSSTSQGVIGLPGYTLDAAAANATQGSVITSTGKNVKLDSGTQMVLRVVSE